ncbi:transglycosylase domain-containing protein [Georgenia alba]|uniref:Transglycosylase domain-containing protein n=1 Tax=Georgenia alba TaxID=2233858 RepID=A0ABW2Q754_9MICO
MSSPSSASGRAVRPAQLLVMLLAFVLVSGLGGVLAAGLVMPAVGAVGAVSQSTEDMFQDLPSELAVPEPSQSSQIVAADGSLLATIYADNRVVVQIDEIAPAMRDAVVAIEDRRFYEHRGVDPEGIMRAFVNNITGGATEGASTLTQQYVKNMLIEQGRLSGDEQLIQQATETTLGRKLEEARLAITIEQQYTKDQILEGYLNIAQFGPSQYGVEVAAQYYFSKSAADLSVAEGALLAGITQSPARHDPVENPENAKARRDLVLSAMHNQGYITQEEYDEARATTIEEMLNVSPTPNGCAAAGISAYFCEYVVDELLLSEEWGSSREDRQQQLYRGGLVIHTTLQPERQQAAQDAVTGAVPINDESGIKMALNAVEPGTGYIRSMVQNTNWGNPSEDDPNATTVNLNVGRSHGGGSGFQSGSSFKVFTLIEWLKQGHSLMDTVNSSNDYFPASSWNIPCGRYEDTYEPNNLEGIGGGYMTVQEATRQSVNLTFVEMANQMNMCNIVENAERMGIQTGTGDPLTPNPAAVLGSNTITPLSQSVAFATLANQGERCDPRAITHITDRSGDEIASFDPSCEQVLEPDVVNGVNHALQEVVTPPTDSTGYQAVLPDGRPAAGKTGTANDDSAAWFVGYTPQLSAAIWMGFQEGTRSMFDSTIDGEYHELVYGGAIPAPTWRAYMERALEGEEHRNFPEAGTDEIYGEQVPIPYVAGMSIDEATATLEDMGFEVSVGDPIYANVTPGYAAGTTPYGTVSAGSNVTILPSLGPAPAPEPEPEPDDDDNGGGGNGGGGNGGGGGGNGGGGNGGGGNGGGGNGGGGGHGGNGGGGFGGGPNNSWPGWGGGSGWGGWGNG